MTQTQTSDSNGEPKGSFTAFLNQLPIVPEIKNSRAEAYQYTITL